MLAAALGDQLGVGTRNPAELELAARTQQVQGGPVLAREEVVDVARREQEIAVAGLHDPSVAEQRHYPTLRRGRRCSEDSPELRHVAAAARVLAHEQPLRHQQAGGERAGLLLDVAGGGRRLLVD